MGTFLLSICTGLAIKLIIALLVENAVIICLFKGKPLTILHIIALCNAFLKCANGKGVYKNTLALECPVAFSCRTPGVGKHMIQLCVQLSEFLAKSIENVNDFISTYPFSPLMHSGHGSTAGGSMPTSVQLAKSMQSSKAGSHDHQLHSWFLPQNLWHPSASWVTLKSREYS